MRNIKFLMCYNGGAYHGFQIQPNAVTIQGTVEAALYQVLGEVISICGCSRTDAGVHAREYCFNAHINGSIPCEGLKKALNSRLPPDIAILDCHETNLGFHARFDALGKEYLYIINGGEVKDVFRTGLVYNYPYPLDVDMLNESAQIFVGTYDFGAFCKAESKALLESTVRKIMAFRVIRQGDEVRFYISGAGFLHNMVRILVGTLIYYAEGKRTIDDIKTALSEGKREYAGITAPACGLYLNKVYYDKSGG